VRSPIEEYKLLIDRLVAIRPSVLARRVRDGVWHQHPPPEQVKFNRVLAELTPGQREVVAEMVQEARDGGIHDTLAVLTDGQYRLSHDGVKLAWEPFDTEMYFDWTARCAGDTWPDEQDRV
jgi:hypothetical protein